MSNKIYYVRIGDSHGNIFVFTSYKAAKEWCKNNTVWDNVKIISAIKTDSRDEGESHYTLSF